MKTKPTLLTSAIFLAAVSICFGQPVITNQPRTQATAPGATVTFQVGATGTAPLAYQWQKNPANGYSDLAERTNAVLTLTNVQLWDAAYYRVVVTNSSGVRASAGAYLYVKSPAMRTNREVIDNFDDNKLTGWNTWSSNDRGLLKETNCQFTVRGYWPGASARLENWAKGWRNINPRTLVEGQRLERRVDLISMSKSSTLVNTGIAGDSTSHGYVLTFGRGFVAILKWLPGFAFLALDAANLPDENVVLSLALTRVQTNLLITARILEKSGQQAVLFEKSVWDTPEVDPTISSNQVYALTGLPGVNAEDWLADVNGSPSFRFDYVDLEVINFNNETNPVAEVTFDNYEVWTYRLPITRYVDVNSTNPAPPYTNWLTAATNIQDAVDVALAGDEIVVTNGTYATGGRAVGTNALVNRVAVDKPLTVWSVNGPQLTIIQGYQVPGTTNGDGAIRCVYLANGASLSGFTLTNGATRGEEGYWSDQDGGGLWCESTTAVASNCVVAGNSARSAGGGASGGTLNDCTLSDNSADIGGATSGVTLNNCTVAGNSALLGGGTFDSVLNNCIVYFNTAAAGPNYGPWSTLNHCCTTPLPADGVGNIANAPLFVDYAGGNLRLLSNSPCINAGGNSYGPGPVDLDGMPRIVSGTVDLGAYEFQGPGSMISYAWLQQYGWPTDGSADTSDSDADSLNNWQEWRCQTCPTNALSSLCLLTATPAGTNVTVGWQSVAGVSYFLERSTNLWGSPPFNLLAPNLAGQPGTTTYTDTNAATLAPLFYRVGVGN